MIEILIFSISLGIILPFLFIKLTKSNKENYGLVLATAIVGGTATYSMGNDIVGLAFPFFAIIFSVLSFLKKSWTVSNTFKLSLKILMGFCILGALGTLI
tara:strand:- start:115 stop:414 length:300 start_codon:yes stop_codon:yes gene_type:complete